MQQGWALIKDKTILTLAFVPVYVCLGKHLLINGGKLDLI